MAADCQSPLELTMEGSCQPAQEDRSELLDLQWKMGMAVSSDSCKSLKSPYVAVTLKVADQSGQITNKSFEMTIPQFQYFFKQFKEMAAVIETV
ncbi:COMM domain-containing protein 6 isoform X2 [Sminthopsis crassicaudata]|uniref:COMM domain-containing protein 6 isoform X2 n=1 Tax=Sminthopsis crassicaudata TaxID=9301 RepID=UPI003D69E7E5